MSLKNYFLKRLCYFLVILTSFYGFIFAQTITVDGDPSDWPAALNGNMVKAFVHDRANVSDDNKFDASKDVEDTPLWDWSIGQVNDKGDITNAGAVLINGDELYFFGDRTAINGDAQIGFWFFQNGTRPVGTTSGNFAPEHAIGDLLILSNFTNGGGQVTIRVYRWVGSGGSEGSLDLVTRTSKAVVNTQYVSAPSYPGWTYQGKNVPSVGTPPPNTYATGSFFEGYVKLERLIETCYASFLMETRNSASVDAALEDFAFGEYNGKPQAPKVTAGSICGPGVVQLSAECSSTDNAVVRWYDAPTGGNLLFTGSNYAPNISQTTTYYVACFRGDGLGCESTRTPVVATVNPKPEVSLSFDPIKCNGDNTTLVANVTSGTAPYTYLWSNGEKTSSISVKAGTYSVVVTDSKGCEVSKEITISEPSKLSMEVSYTPILCNGGKSTVTVSANGGTAPYTGTGSWEVSAGTYTYTVKDANGCEVSKEITISEPSKLSMEVSYTPILCNGGKSTVTVSANGGTAPYTGTGSWDVSAGTYTYTVKDANGCEVSKEIMISEPSKLSMEVSYTPILCNGGKSTVTVSANGGTAPYTGTGSWEVSAGTYTYTVKDANGCEVSKEITISEPSKLSMEVSYTPILCNGGKSTVTVSANGGTAPYTGTGSWDVSAGTYTYTVKDANGCEVSKEITISEPSKLSIEVSYTPILCNGGKSTVTVSANGGTAPYTGTGSWEVSSGTYTYTVKDANGCEVSKEITISEPSKLSMEVSYTPILCNGGKSTVTVSANGGTAPYTGIGSWDVSAGTYTYTVKDANGCEVSKEIMISEPSKLSMEVSYTPILCNGGKSTVTVSANGGTAPYTGTGSWEVSAGTYTYTVKDANGCEVSKEITISEPSKLSMEVSYTPILCNGGKSTVTVSANGGTAPYTGTGSWEVSAGTYTYTVKDANGCEVSKEITISEPSKLSMEVSYTPILCNGGKSTVTVSANGGTAPYTGTGSWEVSAGTYTYTVKDANGCEVSKEITISEPGKLSMEVSYTPILCNGGKSTVTVSANGGTAPYTGTGSWEVSAGIYTYTVKDANGCEVSKEITISEPSKLSMEVSYTPILCNGGKSTVTVSANGGTAPYTGTGSWEVSVGTYTYTVKDANGCEVSKEITITQPTPLALTIVSEKLVCYNGKVQLTANVSGGTSPYTYSWSNGETTQMITVGAGSYTVTVKDANGCMISKNVEVKVPTCDGFTTVTQGGWGAKAAGKNWGAYRDANFAAAFPTGLMVGTALRNLKLSSAKAVDDFLPSGSSPRALDKSYVNPGQTYQNVFAGQVVALTLSVRFDEWDANFSSNSIKLGDLIVNSGTFAGWTVYQILAEANKVLAGEASMYSASQLNAIVDAINNNYDNGKVNLGLLSCPCPTVEKPVAKVAAPAKSTPDVIANQEAVLYPNPSSGEFNLRFDAPKESKILVQIYNAQGTLVADYSSKVVRNNNKASLHVNNSNLAAGLYLVKVKTSTQEKTIKLIIRK